MDGREVGQAVTNGSRPAPGSGRPGRPAEPARGWLPERSPRRLPAFVCPVRGNSWCDLRQRRIAGRERNRGRHLHPQHLNRDGRRRCRHRRRRRHRLRHLPGHRQPRHHRRRHLRMLAQPGHPRHRVADEQRADRRQHRLPATAAVGWPSSRSRRLHRCPLRFRRRRRQHLGSPRVYPQRQQLHPVRQRFEPHDQQQRGRGRRDVGAVRDRQPIRQRCGQHVLQREDRRGRRLQHRPLRRPHPCPLQRTQQRRRSRHRPHARQSRPRPHHQWRPAPSSPPVRCRGSRSRSTPPRWIADPTWTRIDTLARLPCPDWTIDRGRPDRVRQNRHRHRRRPHRRPGRAVRPDQRHEPLRRQDPARQTGRDRACRTRSATSGSRCSAGSSSRGITGSTRPASTWSSSCSWWTGSRSLPARCSRWGWTVRCRRSPGSRPEQEALAELAAGNVLYGETDRHRQRPDRRDPRATSTGPTTSATCSPGTSGRPESLRARHQRAGRDLGCRRRRVPRCRELLDERRTGMFTFRGRQARFRPDVAEYGINERTVGDPSGCSLDADVVPVSELEWSNGQDNLFNAASATPQWVGTGATIRQLEPRRPRQRRRRRPVRQRQPRRSPRTGCGRSRSTSLQTVEGIATGEQLDGGDQEVRRPTTSRTTASRAPRISPDGVQVPAARQHERDRPLEPPVQRRDQRPADVQTEHPWRRRLLDDQFYVEGLHYTCRPGPPDFPIVELVPGRVSPRAHYTTNPFDEDEDPLMPGARTRACTASPTFRAAPTRSPASATAQAAATSLPRSTVANPALVAYYPMDESSGDLTDRGWRDRRRPCRRRRHHHLQPGRRRSLASSRRRTSRVHRHQRFHSGRTTGSTAAPTPPCSSARTRGPIEAWICPTVGFVHEHGSSTADHGDHPRRHVVRRSTRPRRLPYGSRIGVEVFLPNPVDLDTW